MYFDNPLLFVADSVASIPICFDFVIFFAWFRGGFTSKILFVPKSNMRLGVFDATTMKSGENSSSKLIDLRIIPFN